MGLSKFLFTSGAALEMSDKVVQQLVYQTFAFRVAVTSIEILNYRQYGSLDVSGLGRFHHYRNRLLAVWPHRTPSK